MLLLSVVGEAERAGSIMYTGFICMQLTSGRNMRKERNMIVYPCMIAQATVSRELIRYRRNGLVGAVYSSKGAPPTYVGEWGFTLPCGARLPAAIHSDGKRESSRRAM